MSDKCPYTLIFSATYEKRAKKFFKNHSDLLSTYEKILILLSNNPFHPSLRLHKLQGKLKQLHSVSINLQYRILLEFLIQDDKIIFIDIGSHDQIY